MTFRRWLSIFFLVLLTCAVALLLALLHVMKFVERPGFPELDGDPANALQENGFRWRDRQCDILIYGDSTANVGIDPRLITAQTGLSACNIAVSRPVIDNLGGLSLDAFLAHNPRPKLLVLQFGPEDFYPAGSSWKHGGPYSTLVMITRNLPHSKALGIMLRHPADTSQFVLYVLQKELLPRKADQSHLKYYRDTLEHAAESNGQLDLPFPVLTSCNAPPLALYGPLDTAWAARWRRKYEAMGIPVLIRVSPLASCDPQLDKFRKELAGYADGRLEDLPFEDFVVGARHTTPAGSQPETMGLVKMIEQREPGLVHPSAR